MAKLSDQEIKDIASEIVHSFVDAGDDKPKINRNVLMDLIKDYATDYDEVDLTALEKELKEQYNINESNEKRGYVEWSYDFKTKELKQTGKNGVDSEYNIGIELLFEYNPDTVKKAIDQSGTIIFRESASENKARVQEMLNRYLAKINESIETRIDPLLEQYLNFARQHYPDGIKVEKDTFCFKIKEKEYEVYAEGPNMVKVCKNGEDDKVIKSLNDLKEIIGFQATDSGEAKPVKENFYGDAPAKFVKGETYVWTGGAELQDVKYIGLVKDHPDKETGSSVGKGFLFQWPDGSYFELGMQTMKQDLISKVNEAGENTAVEIDDSEETRKALSVLNKWCYELLNNGGDNAMDEKQRGNLWYFSKDFKKYLQEAVAILGKWGLAKRMPTVISWAKANYRTNSMPTNITADAYKEFDQVKNWDELQLDELDYIKTEKVNPEHEEEETDEAVKAGEPSQGIYASIKKQLVKEGTEDGDNPTMDDCDFEITAEQDDTPVRGNAMASGDDEEDEKVEDEIIARLDSGDVWAWASVKVTCSFDGVEGHDYLGNCTYKDAADFEKNSGYYDDMKQEAYKDMLKNLKDGDDTSVEEAKEIISQVLKNADDILKGKSRDQAMDHYDTKDPDEQIVCFLYGNKALEKEIKEKHPDLYNEFNSILMGWDDDKIKAKDAREQLEEIIDDCMDGNVHESASNDDVETGNVITEEMLVDAIFNMRNKDRKHLLDEVLEVQPGKLLTRSKAAAKLLATKPIEYKKAIQLTMPSLYKSVYMNEDGVKFPAICDINEAGELMTNPLYDMLKKGKRLRKIKISKEFKDEGQPCINATAEVGGKRHKFSDFHLEQKTLKSYHQAEGGDKGAINSIKNRLLRYGNEFVREHKKLQKELDEVKRVEEAAVAKKDAAEQIDALIAEYQKLAAGDQQSYKQNKPRLKEIEKEIKKLKKDHEVSVDEAIFDLENHLPINDNGGLPFKKPANEAEAGEGVWRKPTPDDHLETTDDMLVNDTTSKTHMFIWDKGTSILSILGLNKDNTAQLDIPEIGDEDIEEITKAVKDQDWEQTKAVLDTYNKHGLYKYDVLTEAVVKEGLDDAETEKQLKDICFQFNQQQIDQSEANDKINTIIKDDDQLAGLFKDVTPEALFDVVVAHYGWSTSNLSEIKDDDLDLQLAIAKILNNDQISMAGAGQQIRKLIKNYDGESPDKKRLLELVESLPDNYELAKTVIGHYNMDESIDESFDPIKNICAGVCRGKIAQAAAVFQLRKLITEQHGSLYEKALICSDNNLVDLVITNQGWHIVSLMEGKEEATLKKEKNLIDFINSVQDNGYAPRLIKMKNHKIVEDYPVDQVMNNIKDEDMIMTSKTGPGGKVLSGKYEGFLLHY